MNYDFASPPDNLFQTELSNTFQKAFIKNGLKDEFGEKKDRTVFKIPVNAKFIPENNNPFDKNSVRVEVDGVQVGNLSKKDNNQGNRESTIDYRREYGSVSRIFRIYIYNNEKMNNYYISMV